MDFQKFKEEANSIIRNYAVSPPHYLLENGTVFSNDISFANIMVALLKDLEKLLLKHMTPEEKENLPGEELLDFVESVITDFTRLYYEDNH